MSLTAISLMSNMIAGGLCAVIGFVIWQEGSWSRMIAFGCAVLLIRWWVLWAGRALGEFLQGHSLDFTSLEGATRSIHFGVFCIIVAAGLLCGIVAKARTDEAI